MSRKNILLVDTDPGNIETIKGALSERGFQVDCSDDGKEAVKKILAQTPDLILLEVEIPGMDGWEICSLLKQNKATSRIPIIFVSEKSKIHNQLQAVYLGANGFIPKPFSMGELVNRVEQLLAYRERKKE